MNNENISTKVLEKLKDDQVTQKPKWHFIFSDILDWMILVLSIISIAISIGIMVEIIGGLDLDLYSRIRGDSFSYLISSIPFPIVILTILLFIAAIYGLTHSSKGYKITIYSTAFTIVITSCILAVLLIITGLSKSTEKALNENFELYNTFVPNNLAPWAQPSEGFLTGEVLEVQNTDKFILVDPNYDVWSVKTLDPYGAITFHISPGTELKMLGEVTGTYQFEASDIRVYGLPIIRRFIINR